jgi:hypothetical protein
MIENFKIRKEHSLCCKGFRQKRCHCGFRTTIHQIEKDLRAESCGGVHNHQCRAQVERNKHHNTTTQG